MRVMVTGAAGFIGSHLSEELLAGGHEVVGIDCFTDYYDVSRKRRNADLLVSNGSFELIEENLVEADLGSLMGDVEVVFHLAGQPGVRASWGEQFDVYTRENVQATQRLLEAAKGASLRKFVIASSSSVYGNAESYPTGERDLPRPVSPYGVTKLAAEHLAMLYQAAFEVPTVALRYFTIFGPRQRPDMAFCRFIEASAEDKSISVYGDGEQVRDFTYVSDCVAATLAAAERGHPGAVYNVAGGTEATVLDVLEILEDLIGREIRREHRDAVPGDARKTGADTSRARADLGYSPAVSLTEGIRRQLDAHPD